MHILKNVGKYLLLISPDENKEKSKSIEKHEIKFLRQKLKFSRKKRQVDDGLESDMVKHE